MNTKTCDKCHSKCDKVGFYTLWDKSESFSYFHCACRKLLKLKLVFPK